MPKILLPWAIVLPKLAAGSVAASVQGGKVNQSNENESLPSLSEATTPSQSDDATPSYPTVGPKSGSLVSSLTGPATDSKCPICRSRFTDAQKRPQLHCPHCSNRLHNDCVVAWLEHQNNQKCPCCREELISEEMIVKAVNKVRLDLGRDQLWDIDALSEKSETMSLQDDEIIFRDISDRDTVFSDISESVMTDARSSADETELVAIRC
jgi:hypothetical protein